MKVSKQMVKVKCRSFNFNGYLTIEKKSKTIEFIIDNDELAKKLILNTGKEIFYLETVSGQILSCFQCIMTKRTEGLGNKSKLFMFNIGVLIEGYIEDYNSFSLTSYAALYPRIDCIFGGEDNANYTTAIVYQGKVLEIIANRSISEKNDLFGSSKKSGLYVTIKCENGLDIDTIQKLFFNISTIFSFLCDTYVTFQYIEHVQVNKNYIEKIKIYTNILIDDNKIDLFRNNYGILGHLPWEDIAKIFSVLQVPYFNVWLIYTGVLRTNQLLEDKYLNLTRCLEIIARVKTENYIYSKRELQKKWDEYTKSVSQMDLNDDFKDNLIESFQFSNKNSFKVMLLELIKKQSWGHKISGEGKPTKTVIKEIVDIRNALTHENTDQEVIMKSLFFYYQLVKEMLVAFMLIEYGYDYEYEIKKVIEQQDHTYVNTTRMIELTRQLGDIPKPVVKKKK